MDMDAPAAGSAADRVTIGRFARLTGLSVGALQHYDELDLLRPVEIDRFTGYRRYATDQIELGRAIARLRDLEVPLEALRRPQLRLTALQFPARRTSSPRTAIIQL